MSKASWVQRFIGGSEKPPGEFDRSTYNDVDSKRVRSNFWPGGVFDNTEGGPLNSLQNATSSAGAMSKNLQSNQTEKLLYINIPRFILPFYLPSLEASLPPILMDKCVGAGDVIFLLRFNQTYIGSGKATNAGRTLGPENVFSANIAMVNYLLIGMQKILCHLSTVCIQDENHENIRQFKEKITNIESSELKPFNDFLNMITDGDFKNMLDNYYLHAWYEYSAQYTSQTQDHKMKLYMRFVQQHLWDFMKSHIKPGGVFIGSDNQGGQHYGARNPSSFAPTDFVGVIQVAGKNMKVRNVWSACGTGTSGGDVLGFELEYTKIISHPGTTNTTLSPSGVSFRLSSNETSQKDRTVRFDQDDFGSTGGFWLLVPAKREDTTNLPVDVPLNEWFMSFGICDQMSKPCNIQNSKSRTGIDATFSILPAPIQLFMRFGFYKKQLNTTHFRILPKPYLVNSIQTQPIDLDSSHSSQTRYGVVSSKHDVQRPLIWDGNEIGGRGNVNGIGTAMHKNIPGVAQNTTDEVPTFNDFSNKQEDDVFDPVTNNAGDFETNNAGDLPTNHAGEFVNTNPSENVTMRKKRLKVNATT